MGMRVKIVESNVCVSGDDAEERKSQLEDELMKNGKVTRLIRLHHLLQDDGQLRRWRELSPKLATTVDGKLFPYYVTAAIHVSPQHCEKCKLPYLHVGQDAM